MYDSHRTEQHTQTRTGRRAQVRALAEKYFGAWRGAVPQLAAPLPAYACQCSACAAENACAAPAMGAPAAMAPAASSPGVAGSAAAAGIGSTAATERLGSDSRDPAGACGVVGVACAAGPQVAGGERRLEMPARAGPAVMQAYYRPSLHSPDAVTLDVVWCTPSAVS